MYVLRAATTYTESVGEGRISVSLEEHRVTTFSEFPVPRVFSPVSSIPTSFSITMHPAEFLSTGHSPDPARFRSKFPGSAKGVTNSDAP